MANNNRPAHEIRLGRIKAAIWANETENGARHNVTISRLYKDGEQWKDTLVKLVAEQALLWIYRQQR